MFGLLEQTHAEKLSGILGMFNKAKNDLSQFIVKCNQDRDDINARIASLSSEHDEIVNHQVQAHNALVKITELVGE